MLELKGKLQGAGALTGKMHGQPAFHGAFNVPTLVYPGLYNGPTIVTPDRTQQVLATANLLLTSDITIDPIPEPVLVQTIYDQTFTLNQTDFATWTPSTTAAVIKASVTAGTFTAHMLDYEYYIKWETSVDCVTVSGATLKAQLIWEGADQYQAIFKRPSSYANIESDTWNGNATGTYFTVPFMRYYNTSGTVTYTYAISNGIYPALVAPTFSSSTSNTPTVTVKTPNIYAKCNSTYFATARAPQLDKDASTIHIVGKVYRVNIPGPVRRLYSDFYTRLRDEI